MNLFLLLVLSCSCLGVLASLSESALDYKPVLTVKLPRSYKTQSFIDGAWTEPVEFEESLLAKIASKCLNKKYQCWSHTDGIQERGYEETNTMANVLFVLNNPDLSDDRESYMCATSWSGFGIECMQEAGTLSKCVRSLPNKMLESFFCAKMHLDDVESLLRAYINFVYVYTTEQEKIFNVGFIQMDRFSPEFSNRTGLMATLQLPVKGAPNYDELKRELLEDSYQHFAEVASGHLMVKTCSHKSAKQIHSVHGLGDPMVFNVDRILHPVLGGMHERKNCIDNSKLAYSVPLDKQNDEYYVCHGDLPRNFIGFDRGGGLYCWVDKELNLDLRCNTVPDFMFMEDGSPAMFEEHEYAEWFSDCPDDLRATVMEAVKEKFEEATNGKEKRRITRNLDEL